MSRIVKSHLSDVIIPNVTIQDLILNNIKEHESRLAIVDAITGQEYTYGDLLRLTRNVASGLSRLGVCQGDTVAIISPNSPEYVLVFLALLSLGAEIVPINAGFTMREMQLMLTNTQVSYVYTVSAVAKDIIHNEAVSDIKVLISQDACEGCISLKYLLEDDGTAFPVDVLIKPTDTAMILHSSGTTGLPKGVMQTHLNYVANTIQRRHPRLMSSVVAKADQVVLAYLPFYHAYAILAYFCEALYARCTLVVLPKFTPSTFLSAVERYKVTMMSVVPPTVLFMINNPLVEKADLSSLRYLSSASAPLDASTMLMFERKFPKINITQAYGLTEGLIVFNGVIDGPKDSTVGVLVPNAEVKVFNADAKTDLGVTEVGEICTRSPAVMTGYLNRPDATQQTIDKDGWLHTGDIGYFDVDGNFYIVDRSKDLIKVKGYQVSPAELEGLLLTHPEVVDVGVIGVPHVRNGEAPFAFVVRKHSSHITADDLHTFLHDKVISYKRLSGGIKFVDAIPKSATGKILRRALRELSQKVSSNM